MTVTLPSSHDGRYSQYISNGRSTMTSPSGSSANDLGLVSRGEGHASPPWPRKEQLRARTTERCSAAADLSDAHTLLGTERSSCPHADLSEGKIQGPRISGLEGLHHEGEGGGGVQAVVIARKAQGPTGWDAAGMAPGGSALPRQDGPKGPKAFVAPLCAQGRKTEQRLPTRHDQVKRRLCGTLPLPIQSGILEASPAPHPPSSPHSPRSSTYTYSSFSPFSRRRTENPDAHKGPTRSSSVIPVSLTLRSSSRANPRRAQSQSDLSKWAAMLIVAKPTSLMPQGPRATSKSCAPPSSSESASTAALNSTTPAVTALPALPAPRVSSPSPVRPPFYKASSHATQHQEQSHRRPALANRSTSTPHPPAHPCPEHASQAPPLTKRAVTFDAPSRTITPHPPGFMPSFSQDISDATAGPSAPPVPQADAAAFSRGAALGAPRDPQQLSFEQTSPGTRSHPLPASDDPSSSGRMALQTHSQASSFGEYDLAAPDSIVGTKSVGATSVSNTGTKGQRKRRRPAPPELLIIVSRCIVSNCYA